VLNICRGRRKSLGPFFDGNHPVSHAEKKSPFQTLFKWRAVVAWRLAEIYLKECGNLTQTYRVRGLDGAFI